MLSSIPLFEPPTVVLLVSQRCQHCCRRQVYLVNLQQLLPWDPHVHSYACLALKVTYSCLAKYDPVPSRHRLIGR